MIRAPIILRGLTQRQFAASYILEAAPDDCVVEFKEPKRSLEQNALMHGMAKDLSDQVPWCGQTLSVDDWKRFATARLKKDKIVFDCDDKGQPSPHAGLVVLGKSTAKMSVKELREVITWFEWFGAQHGVAWTHERKRAAELEGARR